MILFIIYHNGFFLRVNTSVFNSIIRVLRWTLQTPFSFDLLLTSWKFSLWINLSALLSVLSFQLRSYNHEKTFKIRSSRGCFLNILIQWQVTFVTSQMRYKVIENYYNALLSYFLYYISKRSPWATSACQYQTDLQRNQDKNNCRLVIFQALKHRGFYMHQMF